MRGLLYHLHLRKIPRYKTREEAERVADRRRAPLDNLDWFVVVQIEDQYAVKHYNDRAEFEGWV